MRKVQEEDLGEVNDIQQDAVPIKRKRGRPPSKNKNQNTILDSQKPPRIFEIHYSKAQHEGKYAEFQYPPQISFSRFNLDQNLTHSNISTPFFLNIINNIIELWWSGSSPILFDETQIMKYELVFNIFRFMKYLFDPLQPFLILTNPERINRWLSTFIQYQSYLFSDNENDTDSDLYYTNISKTKLDVLVLSNNQDLSNFSLTDFSLLILDQPNNFDNFTYLETHDIKSYLLIGNSSTENIPTLFNIENPVSITIDDMKNNRYVSEILHFCPMTQLQVIQTQQLFKSNKSRLHQIPEPPSERLTMFLSHMVKQVKSISVHPSLSTSYNSFDEQSGKFQELLKIVENLQKNENKIAIIGQDPRLLPFTSSYFIKNRINTYNVNQLLKGKKKVQLIEEFNQSDSSSVLLIDPENFFEFIARLIIDKIIILEVDICLSSMIDEILTWKQAQHDNTPQIIRLITDNSIELPIYEMQYNLSENNDTENPDGKKDELFDFDKMNSETLLLLLKQSASLCFEYDGDEIRKPLEICYSHSPQNLFNIATEFNQNFWNDITQIETQHQDSPVRKNQQQKMLKQQSSLRGSSQQKQTDINSEDNSSIATRVKKDLLRRGRLVDQEKSSKNEKNKSKISTRNSSKKYLKSKKLKAGHKKSPENNYSENNESDDEEVEYDDESRTNKKSKYRQSPRLRSMKKYKGYESESESDEDDDDDDSEESENEYDFDSERKKETDLFNEEEEEEEIEEEEEEQHEESENEVEEPEEESEDDENLSIAQREKKRLIKKQQRQLLLQQKLQSKEQQKSTKSAKRTKSTKRLKRSQKVTKSSTKKSNEQKQKQNQLLQQQQKLQKPRKHIPKFDAMVGYWNPRHFTHYLELLRDFGFDRWDKFSSFERPIQELRKIGALIIRNLETTSRENRLLREYFANELRSSELSRLDNALPFVRKKLVKVNRSEFLAELTGMLLINKLTPKSTKDIILPKAAYEVSPLDEEWTEEDDKTLLFHIHENGLFHIPSTFKHNLSKNFIKRFRSFFVVDPSNPNSANITSLTGGVTVAKAKTGGGIIETSKQTVLPSTTKTIALKKKGSQSLPSKGKGRIQLESTSLQSSTKPPRGITIKVHIAIVQTLCSFGYPNLFRFKAQMNNIGNVADSDLEDYIETIFQFSACTSKEDRRILSMRLAGKIEKYNAKKIIGRKEMFEKLRKDALNYDQISAEDIEILAAMSFHGFANTETSPVLLSSCAGECTDQRLFQRAKAIWMEEQIHNEQPISFFLKQAHQQKIQEEEEEAANAASLHPDPSVLPSSTVGPNELVQLQREEVNDGGLNQNHSETPIENNNFGSIDMNSNLDENANENEIQAIQQQENHESNDLASTPVELVGVKMEEEVNIQPEQNLNFCEQPSQQQGENMNFCEQPQQQQEQNLTFCEQHSQQHGENMNFYEKPSQQQQEQNMNFYEQPQQQQQEQNMDEQISQQHPEQILQELSTQQPSWLPQLQTESQDSQADSFPPAVESQQQQTEVETQPPQPLLNPAPDEADSIEFAPNSYGETLFPLKLNDRQVLKSIGRIDERFHDGDYIYPVGYECSVACMNPFNDSQGLVWLNLSIRLLNTKIDKADKTNNNGDFLIFVVRKEKEKSPEISDDSPAQVFEKIRQRIIRKTQEWIPPFDGYEMFGLNSAKVHRILLEMPNIEKCTRYRRRFFRLPMTIEHDWPILGRYEDKKKQLQMYTMFTMGENGNPLKSRIVSESAPLTQKQLKNLKNLKKVKHLNLKGNKKEKMKTVSQKVEKSPFFLMKKKKFGDLVKPLVINCKPIFNAEIDDASVSVSGLSNNLSDLMKRYEKWDKDIIQKYLPIVNNEDQI